MVDIGESLVGAYMRHVVGCQVITYNSFIPGSQGEIDVIAIRSGSPRTIWLCEVTTHTGGMLIVRKGKDATLQVIREKLDRLRAFAGLTFSGDEHRYEWWSPRVSVGRVTEAMLAIEAEWQSAGHDLHFVINETYTDRIRALADHAAKYSSTTNEPSYRMLQLLTRLRGGKFEL